MIRIATPETAPDAARAAWTDEFRARWDGALADEPALADDLAHTLGFVAARRFSAAPADEMQLDVWGLAALRAVGRGELAGAAQARWPECRRSRLAAWRALAERGASRAAAELVRRGAARVVRRGGGAVWRMSVPAALRGQPPEFTLGWTSALRAALDALADVWPDGAGRLELSGAAEWARSGSGSRAPRRAAALARCRRLRDGCEEWLARHARRRGWRQVPAVCFADLWV